VSTNSPIALSKHPLYNKPNFEEYINESLTGSRRNPLTPLPVDKTIIVALPYRE
jgi:hypothetical protein